MEQTTNEPKGIYQAMAAIAAEIGAIGKDKRCTQGASFAYRGIDDVYNALNPIMSKHGVFVLPIAGNRTTETRQTRNGATMEIVVMRMTYKFCHADGSFVEAVTVGQAMDSGDKATNKAMAIAHKYAILQAFCIPTEDMEDPDYAAEQLAPTPQQRQQYQQRQQSPQQQRPQQTQAQPTRQAQGSEQMPEGPSEAQIKAMMALFKECGIEVREVRIKYTGDVIGRNVNSCSELTRAEAAKVIDSLQKQKGGNN